jgi:hypothetical protein
MIVGIFLGVKILCNHIFREPWDIEELKLSKKFEKTAKTISECYISYFQSAVLAMSQMIDVHD